VFRVRVFFFKLVAARNGFLARGEYDIEITGAGVLTDIQVQEQVIWALDPLDAGDGNPGVFQFGCESGDVVAIHQQLQAGLLKSGPPEWRLDAGNDCRFRPCSQWQQQPQNQK
jgi:hypothetical protein